MTSGCLLDFFCCQSNLTFHSPPALYASKHMRTCSSLFLATARGGRSSSENQSKPVVSMFFSKLPPVTWQRVKILQTPYA